MNIQEERKSFEAWFESQFESTKLHKFDDGVYWHERAQMSWEAWQAAKSQAVLEIQQSKQAEIDDLKAQLKAAHESRIEFVEYCRKIESNDFVLVPKEPTQEMIDAGMGSFDFPLDNGRFSNHDLIFAYRAMLESQESK